MNDRPVNQYVNPNRDRESRGEAPGSVFLPLHPRAYAVRDIPETTDPDYTTGYATQLDPGIASGTTPDPIRTGDVKPPVNSPNNRGYNARRYSDFHRRHSVEEVEQDWHTRQRKVPGGQNPLWSQERQPIRGTATRAPMPYMFTRPWHIPRHVQDAIGEDAVIHLSMADHRRAYEIMGQAPQGRLGVNTYRLDPRPWDEQLHFRPQAEHTVSGGSFGGTRSYRL
jgi:hypothetical protein